MKREFSEKGCAVSKRKPKRKLTAAEKRERCGERKEKYTTIFINGKQKRVPAAATNRRDGRP